MRFFVCTSLLLLPLYERAPWTSASYPALVVYGTDLLLPPVIATMARDGMISTAGPCQPLTARNSGCQLEGSICSALMLVMLLSLLPSENMSKSYNTVVYLASHDCRQITDIIHLECLTCLGMFDMYLLIIIICGWPLHGTGFHGYERIYSKCILFREFEP